MVLLTIRQEEVVLEKVKRERIATGFASAAGILGLVALSNYSWFILAGSAKPVFATWIIFLVTASLSFWTYWSANRPGERSVIANMGNALDLAGPTVVLFCLFIRGNVSIAFDRFESWCLIASLAILVMWRINRNTPRLSNLLIQIVMVVAYFPTFHRLLHTTINTEPLGMWAVSWFVAALALVPAALRRDLLAVMYSLRSLLCVTIILVLIARLLIP